MSLLPKDAIYYFFTKAETGHFQNSPFRFSDSSSDSAARLIPTVK